MADTRKDIRDRYPDGSHRRAFMAGWTDEELDFIINYDIKYRMGAELEEEEQ